MILNQIQNEAHAIQEILNFFYSDVARRPKLACFIVFLHQKNFQDFA